MRGRWILTVALALAAASCNPAEKDGGEVAAAAGRTDSGGVQVGDTAPSFVLPGYPMDEFALADYRGRNLVVLYFYPKDNTPDCITEACRFRDTAAEFARHGAMIVGVSQDSLVSHELFADEYELPFPLLSDEGGKVRALYGNPDGGRSLIDRITYVIDQQGVVRDIISVDDASGVRPHIDRSLATVRQLATEPGNTDG